MHARIRIVLLLLLLGVAVLSVYIVTQPLMAKAPPPLKQRTSLTRSTIAIKGTSSDDQVLSQRTMAPQPMDRVSPSTVTVVPAMSHPSCLAATFLLAHVPGQRRWTGEPPIPLLPQHQYWREYARPEIVCYKHGGHFSPGYPRGGSPRDSSDATIAPQLRRLVFHGAYLWRGELYVVDGENATRSEPFFAYFPYIAASWPQPVLHSITVHHVAALPEAAVAASHTLHSRRAVLIPPTDFLSPHHTVVDLVFPLFHLLLEDGGELGSGVDIITARSLWSTNPFDERSCVVSKERCLNTPFGSLFAAVSLASSPKERHDLLHQTVLPSQFACIPRRARERGSDGIVHNEALRAQAEPSGSCAGISQRFIYGLGEKDDQLKDIPPTSSFGSGATPSPVTPAPVNSNGTDGTLIRVDRLLVGLPGHCDQLWGGDAHYAELVVHRQRLRAPLTDPYANHSLLDRRGVLADPKESIDVSLLEKSFDTCQRVLRKFRDLVVESSSSSSDSVVGISHLDTDRRASSFSDVGPPSSSLHSRPIVAGPNASVHIVFTSRKGDWARQIHNEDVVVRTLAQHVATKYGSSSTVRSIKFSGSVADQLSATQMDVARTTVFVGNHGANLLNSLYLRPNAGVILLSMGNPGFYPWSLFPDWLHFRDLVVDPFCNVRLRRGKRCRLVQGHLESHVNDMVLTQQKIHTLLLMLDDLIMDQHIRPRR